MLKIKDNIDLKELEKFGFKKDYCSYYCESPCGESLWVSSDRSISVFGEQDIDEEIIDVLFDIIKSDMVERVNDNG